MTKESRDFPFFFKCVASALNALHFAQSAPGLWWVRHTHTHTHSRAAIAEQPPAAVHIIVSLL